MEVVLIVYWVVILLIAVLIAVLNQSLGRQNDKIHYHKQFKKVRALVWKNKLKGYSDDTKRK